MRIGSPLTARAAASTAGLSDNISDALGEVNIFSAAGAPVMFKDLWDQNEVRLFLSTSCHGIDFH